MGATLNLLLVNVIVILVIQSVDIIAVKAEVVLQDKLNPDLEEETSRIWLYWNK